jgi:hypothetical protein
VPDVWSDQGGRLKYIVVNDPHLDITAPSSRRSDDYLEASFKKLQFITDLCVEIDAKALVCTGDWFHKKNPQGVPHRLVRRLVEWADNLTRYHNIPILTTLGNHDVQFNDMSRASVEKQPVSLLLQMPGVIRLETFGPWYTHGILFIGRDYRPDLHREDGSTVVDPSQFEIPLTAIGGFGTVVQVTHASVLPEKQMWTHLLASEVAQISPATICHTGHIHEDLGIHRFERERGPFWWTNVGSMTRGSLTEETIARQPKVLVVDVEEGEEPVFREVVLPHQPAEEIYDVESYREAKTEEKAFRDWTVKLREELHATATQDKTLTDLVSESALDHRGRALALRLLNEAGA